MVGDALRRPLLKWHDEVGDRGSSGSGNCHTCLVPGVEGSRANLVYFLVRGIEKCLWESQK